MEALKQCQNISGKILNLYKHDQYTTSPANRGYCYTERSYHFSSLVFVIKSKPALTAGWPD